MDGAPAQTMIAPSFDLSDIEANRSELGSAKLPVDWNEWDRSLWTAEQRRQIESGAVPRQVFVLLGVVLSAVVVFGLVANATILYVFSRFKRLRTPANVFIINLTLCDLFSCLIHPLAVYSCFRGRWSFGKAGCNAYGMGVGFFGLNSIVTLSAIACERYLVITSSSCRSVVAKWRITRAQARKICAAIWLHCGALVSPPLLLGWSSYQPEGVLVSCSWDYTTRTLSNRLYYVYLLVMGFAVPVGLLAFCYSAILRFIVHSSREMTRLVMTSDGRSALSRASITFRNKRRETDVRTALIILSLAVACLAAWTPYAVVSLVGQFAPLGPPDDESGERTGDLSPLLTTLPAFFAKTAIVFNPIVYGFSHPQFRTSVRRMLNQVSAEQSSANGARIGPHHHQHNNNDALTAATARRRSLSLRRRLDNDRVTVTIRSGSSPDELLRLAKRAKKRPLEPWHIPSRRSLCVFRCQGNGTRLAVMKRIDSRAESIHRSSSDSDAEPDRGKPKAPAPLRLADPDPGPRRASAPGSLPPASDSTPVGCQDQQPASLSSSPIDRPGIVAATAPART